MLRLVPRPSLVLGSSTARFEETRRASISVKIWVTWPRRSHGSRGRCCCLGFHKGQPRSLRRLNRWHP